MNIINHSADIDYKGFLKIYRKYTKELYYFLTIDTIILYDLEKIFWILYKNDINQ